MRKGFLFVFSLVLWIGISSCEDGDAPPEDEVRLSVTPKIETATVGSEITFTCDIYNYNGDQSLLTYNWTSSCESITDGASTNTIVWQAPDEPTDCNLNVAVSDGEFSDEYSFSVLVEEEKDMVGVYYYPWYGGNDFHGGKYLREFLEPAQLPMLGEYNDTEARVIEKHFEWSEYAGINLWVSSWWGPNDRTDKTLRNRVMMNPNIKDLKIALFYESTSLMTDRSVDGDGRWQDLSEVANHIQHMATYYWNHPNYYKIDGRPVLFIYLTRAMEGRGVLEEAINIMREQATLAGFDIYIVGDHVFGNPPSTPGQMGVLDAVTNYDVYGSSGGRNVLYATQQGVDTYYANMAGWKSLADQVGVKFIPAASPGYNDTGVRKEALHQPLSRKLSENYEFGSLFKANIEGAQQLTDPDIRNLFMINSWNEWHEDTQIEPVASAPATDTDISGTGVYTWGLEYEGYGMRYLDILKEAVEK